MKKYKLFITTPITFDVEADEDPAKEGALRLRQYAESNDGSEWLANAGFRLEESI
jgi:hypothetical protein